MSTVPSKKRSARNGVPQPLQCVYCKKGGVGVTWQGFQGKHLRRRDITAGAVTVGEKRQHDAYPTATTTDQEIVR